MKDVFKGFYSPDDKRLKELWEDDGTIFIFDANVLLNLYGYAEKTRSDFFNILKKLDERIWLPYHAGLEYQRRRLEVIKNEKAVFNEIDKNLANIKKIFNDELPKLDLKRRFPKLYENTQKFESEIIKAIHNYQRSVAYWNKEQPCVRSHDKIRAMLNKLFENKVGNKPPDQDWLDKLYKEGEDRYKKKIPPGFKDADKDSGKEGVFFHFDGYEYNRAYGDLIIWQQIIDKAGEENIKNVIFITDDTKDDWWYTLKSNGTKTIGPLAGLQDEIYRKAGLTLFHMYRTSLFLEDGKKHLNINIDERSILDASSSIKENTHKFAANIFDRTYKIESSDLLDQVEIHNNRAIPSWNSDKYGHPRYKANKGYVLPDPRNTDTDADTDAVKEMRELIESKSLNNERARENVSKSLLELLHRLDLSDDL